jgi:hypothetical protein
VTLPERFTVIIAALGLLFTVMSTLLVFIIRITSKWTSTRKDLAALVREVHDLVVLKDRDHEAIRRDVAERQAAGDRVHDQISERLTWLERLELTMRRNADPHS